MKLFIDTGAVGEVEEIASWGVLAGATTNPIGHAEKGCAIRTASRRAVSTSWCASCSRSQSERTALESRPRSSAASASDGGRPSAANVR